MYTMAGASACTPSYEPAAQKTKPRALSRLSRTAETVALLTSIEIGVEATQAAMDSAVAFGTIAYSAVAAVGMTP
jgi:hypothetical protein